MSLTRVALAMIVAAVITVLLAPRPGPYVLVPVPAGEAQTVPACHPGEVLSIQHGVFHVCRVG